MLDRKVSGHRETGASMGEWTGPVCAGGVVSGTRRVIFQALPAAETKAREPGVWHIQRGQFFMPRGYCACWESAGAMLGSASCFYV